MSFNHVMLFAEASESRVEREDIYLANRGMKRKAVDQGLKCVSFHNHFACHMMSTLTKACVISLSLMICHQAP